MRAAALAAAAMLAACPGGDRRPLPPIERPTDEPPDADTSLDPDRPELPEVPEDERIAAIEHAMNALAPVANQCWAAAAADDFRLAGDVRALISVGRASGPGAAVEISADTTADDVLLTCLENVLGAYAWAPPLAGQAFELPFRFSAPSMQNVIDRRFVPRAVQRGVSMGVLLDETNTGNPALSLIEVRVPAGGTLPDREVERLEVWNVVTGKVTFAIAGGSNQTLGTWDMLVAPAGVHLSASSPDGFHALIAIVPGGREGAARAGALPGKASVVPPRAKPPQPAVIRFNAKGYPLPTGEALIQLERPAAGGKLALSWLKLNAGATVPPHVHAAETEALYVVGGMGTMTVGGVDVAITADSVVQVPKGVEHSFKAATDVLAIQLYTPAGPEQRFKKPPPKPAK